MTPTNDREPRGEQTPGGMTAAQAIEILRPRADDPNYAVYGDDTEREIAAALRTLLREHDRATSAACAGCGHKAIHDKGVAVHWCEECVAAKIAIQAANVKALEESYYQQGREIERLRRGWEEAKKDVTQAHANERVKVAALEADLADARKIIAALEQGVGVPVEDRDHGPASSPPPSALRLAGEREAREQAERERDELREAITAVVPTELVAAVRAALAKDGQSPVDKPG